MQHEGQSMTQQGNGAGKDILRDCLPASAAAAPAGPASRCGSTLEAPQAFVKRS